MRSAVSALLIAQDVLGSTELNEAVVYLAAGRGDLIRERIYSGIKSYVRGNVLAALTRTVR